MIACQGKPLPRLPHVDDDIRLQDVDFYCVGWADMSQPSDDSADRSLHPVAVREGYADQRFDGAPGCAGSRERAASGAAESSAEDAGQFVQAALAGPEAEWREQACKGNRGLSGWVCITQVHCTWRIIG